MKKIIWLSYFMLGCGCFLQAQKIDSYNYFPANVGDRWEYWASTPGLGYTIVRDSIDVKDSSRFIFLRYPPSFTGAEYRIHDNKVYFSPQFDNWLLYKLDALVGETWIVRAIEGRAAKVFNISQQTVFGKETTVKTIGYFKLTGSDTTITETSIFINKIKLAYGFGMISDEDGASQPEILIGCRINGVTYGTVGVKFDEKKEIISSILFQNYPNPFNSSTIISFTLARNSHVIIKIYDVLGRAVKEVANDYYTEGYHSINLKENNLASGMYLLRLITNENVIIKKMILQK